MRRCGVSVVGTSSSSLSLLFISGGLFVPTDAMEDELLRSIEEVDARIQSLRKEVRAVLRSAQSDSGADPVESKQPM
jgi:hypothetical protein